MRRALHSFRFSTSILFAIRMTVGSAAFLPTICQFGTTGPGVRRLSMIVMSSKLTNTVESTLDWDDRIGLQKAWNNEEKGWQVAVEWRQTPYGAGLFALQDIPKETILRVGQIGTNLVEFRSISDIESFCNKGLLSLDRDDDKSKDKSKEYWSRLNYVKDYLWGFHRKADANRYEIPGDKEEEDRFFGMWIPGNGLNHNPNPNTVYRSTDQGINLVALRDIVANEELYDDYRRHGRAPDWLLEFSQQYNVTLNFAGCNDFVDLA